MHLIVFIRLISSKVLELGYETAAPSPIMRSERKESGRAWRTQKVNEIEQHRMVTKLQLYKVQYKTGMEIGHVQYHIVSRHGNLVFNRHETRRDEAG